MSIAGPMSGGMAVPENGVSEAVLQALQARLTPVANSVDTSRWFIVYPTYLNSTKTIAQGRRIGKEKAVPNPHILEVSIALQELGVPYKVEVKAYPRDFWDRCRVRVQLKGADGSVLNAEIPNKHVLLGKLGPLIARLQHRVAKPEPVAAAGKKGKKKGKR